jgi:hypothetical protein
VTNYNRWRNESKSRGEEVCLTYQLPEDVVEYIEASGNPEFLTVTLERAAAFVGQ